MKRYYYKTEVKRSPDKTYPRGYNIRVSAYKQLKDGHFLKIGTTYHDGASWKGERAAAAEIISQEEGHRMDERGYNLVSKNIEIINLP